MKEKQLALCHKIAQLFPALELILPTDVLLEFTSAAHNDISLFHFGLGLFLRNNLLNSESRLYGEFISAGITHKDDMSSIVLSMFHAYLNEK